MGQVSSVEKKGPVYLIYLDGRFFLRINGKTYDRFPLTPGSEIDEDAWIREMEMLQTEDAYDAALTALERSSRSEAGLRNWLYTRGYMEAPIEAAMVRLKKIRLIDDQALAARILESGLSQGLSKRAIRQKMRIKGISEENADEALLNIPEDHPLQAATQQAAKLFTRYQHLDKRAARAKLGQALARRGFSWDVIAQVVNSVLDE